MLAAAVNIELMTNGVDADVPNGPDLHAGDTVTWTYRATNPGTVPLSNIEISDAHGTPGNSLDDFAPTPTESTWQGTLGTLN